MSTTTQESSDSVKQQILQRVDEVIAHVSNVPTGGGLIEAHRQNALSKLEALKGDLEKFVAAVEREVHLAGNTPAPAATTPAGEESA